ncbi:NADP-dependent phosphogluconate dehydrogenase [Lachnospiraceae bacterium MD1]|uniref:6-phosphogluconate dehydrogenase, decarboxylating n=1 Tax=Variimorphobacter saccharofermentans TaxID=2755051 RepID=A0A839K1S1_9FIRM|nr:NADP-dependent phosphogluconate dehydrogenase [Variimorphobacter saccharofermentans]MBB2183152.1 NADP-dependent phosphogluconate dehydrogenase [Variimorphobacter saccharofermentans]
MKKHQIGVIGLAVMGKNLALNIAEHGFRVAVYNRSTGKTNEILEEAQNKEYEGNLSAYYSLEEFTEDLETPRKIILMVKAGDAVDDMINQLLPFLSKGDLIMDGGNSYYMDTIRRNKVLKELGYHFLGTGISGGEEGARKGPAIMPGGAIDAYQMMEPILTAISAKVDNEPCSTYIGEDGAGHFVKMVHNGIEYADMQLIGEAYDIMKKILHLTPQELHEVFDEWNQGELNSYLIDITADIFAKKDIASDHYLVDMILDVGGQKGTGKWTSQIALDLGAPIPTITNAVYERYLSAKKDERIKASQKLKGPESIVTKQKDFIEAIRRALYASKICAYAQGFGLLHTASEQYGWKLRFADIAKIFRGGCIIRAQFLNRISDAYNENPELENLLLAEYFSDIINWYQTEWREVIKAAISAGIAIPAFSSALAYYDSYRSKELPMNLLQAQRDYFGAHTYQRIDKEGIYHTQW